MIHRHVSLVGLWYRFVLACLWLILGIASMPLHFLLRYPSSALTHAWFQLMFRIFWAIRWTIARRIADMNRREVVPFEQAQMALNAAFQQENSAIRWIHVMHAHDHEVVTTIPVQEGRVVFGLRGMGELIAYLNPHSG